MCPPVLACRVFSLDHAYWWNHDGVGVFRSRFRRRDSGEQIIGARDGLEEDSALLFQYATPRGRKQPRTAGLRRRATASPQASRAGHPLRWP